MKTILRKVFWIGFLSFAGWFLFAFFFGYRWTEAFDALAFGWARFAGRNWSAATFNWSGVATVLISSLIIWALLCALMRRRWAMQVFAGFWLFFVLTMAASGFFVKAREQFLSDEPRFQLGDRECHYAMRQAALGVRIALSEGEGNLNSIHADYYDKRLMENLQLGLFPAGKTNAVLLMAPRLESWRKRWGFAVCDEGFAVRYPMEFLSEIVSNLNRLPKNEWNADLRSFLDKNVSARANAARTEDKSLEI